MMDFMQRLDGFAMGESAWKEWQQLISAQPEADLTRRVLAEHMAHLGDLGRSGALVAGDQACVLTEIKETTLALLDIVTSDRREVWLVSQKAGHRIANRIMAILKGTGASHATE